LYSLLTFYISEWRGWSGRRPYSDPGLTAAT